VGFASGQRRLVLDGLIPALQRAGTGNGLVGMAFLENKPQEGRTPGRVLLMEEEDLVVQRMGRRRLAVGRLEGRRRTTTEACEQVLDGPAAEAECVGDGGRGLVVLKAFPDLLAERLRQRSRHRVPRKKSGRVSEVNIGNSCAGAKLAVALRRKTGCRITAQN
jgi:hypothetical protein